MDFLSRKLNEESDMCNNLGEYAPVWIIDHPIGSVMLALGLIYFLMSIVIIYFIKIQEYYARSGNDEAVQAVIFPIFVNVLWANALVNIYVGIIALTFTFEPFDTANDSATWSFSIMYALQHLGKILNFIFNELHFCFLLCTLEYMYLLHF